jgi:hypothetical protein
MSNLANSRSHEAIKAQRNDDENKLRHEATLFYASELGFVEQIETMINDGCVVRRNKEGEKVKEWGVSAEILETLDGHLFIRITQDVNENYDNNYSDNYERIYDTNDVTEELNEPLDFVEWDMTDENIGDLFEQQVLESNDILVNLGLINIIKNINTEKNG